MTRHLVFVYGTLLQGDANHHFMHRAKLMAARAWTTGILVDTGLGYPTMRLKGSEWVYGELYEVDDATLQALDQLETYVEGAENNAYDRVKVAVKTEDGAQQAFTYVAGTKLKEKNKRIAGGNWRNYPSQH